MPTHLQTRDCLIVSLLLCVVLVSPTRGDEAPGDSEPNASRQSAAEPAGQEERLLFGAANADARYWQIVNDGVMGGRSQGRVRLTDDGTLRFTGTLSLANNGGFSSLRSRPAALRLGDWEALVIRLRGDGRSYYANLRVPTRRVAFSYRAPVQTKANQWQEVRIPISAFQATSYGQPVRARLDQARVDSIGFTLSDKRAGPFALEIDWIKAVRKARQ